MFFIILLCAFALAGPVSYYGELKVRNNSSYLEGAKTKSIVQVRGVSFGWSNTGWESERFYRADAVEHMAKDWKAEIVRAAYGATSRAFSHADAVANRERVEIAIDAAIENDVYIIIDWHSHSAQNQKEYAIDFFRYMAEKYGSYDNVIFELYNEPVNAEWPVIKSYAEEVIPVIREYSDNLILVGTPFYSQRLQEVVGDAIVSDPEANVGYVLHFYSRSHSVDNFRSNMNAARDNGLAIFVTEYGTTDADGGQSSANNYNSHNEERSDEWHKFMDSRKISSVAWNINDKYEGSAFFGTVQKGFDFEPESWSDTTKMTESGKYIFKKLNEYYKCLAWNPNRDESSCDATPILSSASLPVIEAADAAVYTLSGKKIGTLSSSNLKNGVYILISKQNGAVQRKILSVVK
jgi:endoglucanase